MKVLVARYGAYGDVICISHLPRLLKDQGFTQVDFELNYKGTQVLSRNPFIDNFLYYEPTPSMTLSKLQSHWDHVSKGYDKFINLYGSLEYGCIAMEDDKLYPLTDAERRKELTEVNFYDQTTAWAGYPNLIGKYKPELYFNDEEIRLTEAFLKTSAGKFNILINLNGTSRHKRFVQAKEVCEKILEKYQDAHIILTGDDESLVIAHDRITSIVKKKPFMQAVLIAKYVDCVIAMESGLGLGAGVWGTPTIFLLTASSWHSVMKYAQNDLSLQSPVECSPCHKGPYEYKECPIKDGNPECVYFNVNDILERVERAYQMRFSCV